MSQAPPRLFSFSVLESFLLVLCQARRQPCLASSCSRNDKAVSQLPTGICVGPGHLPLYITRPLTWR